MDGEPLTSSTTTRHTAGRSRPTTTSATRSHGDGSHHLGEHHDGAQPLELHAHGTPQPTPASPVPLPGRNVGRRTAGERRRPVLGGVQPLEIFPTRA